MYRAYSWSQLSLMNCHAMSRPSTDPITPITTNTVSWERTLSCNTENPALRCSILGRSQLCAAQYSAETSSVLLKTRLKPALHCSKLSRSLKLRCSILGRSKLCAAQYSTEASTALLNTRPNPALRCSILD